jgi:hypothetical protein
VRRAGALLLGACLIAVLVWWVPLHAASSLPHAQTGGSSTTTTSRVPQGSKPASLSQVKRLVAASVKVQQLNAQTSAELSKITYDNADFMKGIPIECASATYGCVFGDTRSSIALVLFGDSHARMWLPAIIPIATADHLKLIVIGRTGCPLAVHRISRMYGGCASVIAGDIKEINRIKPAAIVLSDRTTDTGVDGAQWESGLTQTIDELRPSGAEVALIGDIQVFDSGMVSDLEQCLADHPFAVQECAIPNPNGAAPGREQAEERAIALAHDLYVNRTSWLCTRQRCSPVIGDDIAYWDAFHVSVRYATYLSGVMGGALSEFLTSAIADRSR